MFGSELWYLTKTDIACFERCQNWFIRKVFNLPKFFSHLLLLKISSLISVENEISGSHQELFDYPDNTFGFIKDVVFLMHKLAIP